MSSSFYKLKKYLPYGCQKILPLRLVRMNLGILGVCDSPHKKDKISFSAIAYVTTLASITQTMYCRAVLLQQANYNLLRFQKYPIQDKVGCTLIHRVKRLLNSVVKRKQLCCVYNYVKSMGYGSGLIKTLSYVD